MLETDNYKLPLYEGNDAPNLLDGYNAAMRTIDGQIKNTNDNVTAQGNNIAGKAPTNHATSAGTYGLGTDALYGHVKLSNATNSTSGTGSGIAATPAAVKAAYDEGANALALAQTASTNAASALSTANGKAPTNHASTATTYGVGTTANYGHVKISDSISTSATTTSGIAATPYAVAQYLADMLNFDVPVSVPVTNVYSGGTVSGNIYFTQNKHRTLFKVYGALKAQTSHTQTLVDIPGISGRRGLKITSTAPFHNLMMKDGTAITIDAGIYFAQPLSNSIAYDIGREIQQIIIGTDANLYLPLGVSTSSTNSYGRFIYLPPCIYVAADFGDSPIPSTDGN